MKRILLMALGLACVLTSLRPDNAVMAQAAVKQIKMTEAQIGAFITSQNDINEVLQKYLFGSPSERADPKIREKLDSQAKKHEFKDYLEFIDVFNNIGLVMSRVDPQTKTLIDPEATIKKEIAETTADKSIGGKNRKQMLKELREQLKGVQEIQYPSNIELVMKNYDKLKDIY